MAKATILTVDDDPGVSRAIARDLRRQYGDRFRVLRAPSGDEALEALRELKLRGDPVAVMIADYRMPAMNGVQFLEAAMDLFPRARRVLLTAYADTGAAIDAINVVDLDHYLLKPWSPPEENLYPVLDTLLELWDTAPDPDAPETRLVGHRWSAPSFAVREFLARNLVPYRWIAADEPEGTELLEAAGLTAADVPLVITTDGKTLHAPTEAELAERVGLSTSPASDFYDVVVIGAGPAGLGAAVYAASEGLRTVLVERSATGGQAGQSSRIENYLGFPDGVSGAQLTDRARRQAARFGAEILSATEVVAMEAAGAGRVLRFADDTSIGAHTVVLATGVSYRRLAGAHLDSFKGAGVFYGSASFEAANCRGDDVYIVGGANSAGQAAVYFSRYAGAVHLVIRGPDVARSMSHYLIQQIQAVPNIRIHTCTEVMAGDGSGHLEKLTLRDSRTGTVSTVDATWLFVFIGAEPQTDWLDGLVARDDRGFVLTGPDLPAASSRSPRWPLTRAPYHLETSVPGVFAAGDVRAESVKRVASAVGEGAMAVTLVHRYLEAQ